jgi:hypothetical protein
MKELAIPKNHNQRMYKFGYDTAREETLKEVEKIINKFNGKDVYCVDKKDLIEEINKLKEDLKK